MSASWSWSRSAPSAGGAGFPSSSSMPTSGRSVTDSWFASRSTATRPKPSQPSGSRIELAGDRVRLAQFGAVGRLVDRAGHSADDQQPHAVVARPDLARGAGPDPDEGLAVEGMALAAHLDLGASAEGEVDL